MIILCPHCGNRLSTEFSYLGDAALLDRPDYEDGDEQWSDYVYLRDNPAGPHRELWRHSAGCGNWLIVTRDTRSHELLSSEPVMERS